MHRILSQQKQNQTTLDEKTVSAIWQGFGSYIAKQLRNGKGVSVPRFGNFTFSATLVDLAVSTQTSFNLDLPASPLTPRHSTNFYKCCLNCYSSLAQSVAWTNVWIIWIWLLSIRCLLLNLKLYDISYLKVETDWMYRGPLIHQRETSNSESQYSWWARTLWVPSL